jgi:hypothetical protein
MTTGGDNTMTTSFSNRCFILGEMWLQYRDDQDFEDFVEYNDLGLPLAYALSNDIVHSTATAEDLVNETYELLIASLGIEDTGFDTLEQILEKASK